MSQQRRPRTDPAVSNRVRLANKSDIALLSQHATQIFDRQNTLIDEIVNLRESTTNLVENYEDLFELQKGLQKMQEMDAVQQQKVWSWLKGPGGRQMTVVQRCFDVAGVVAFFIMVWFVGELLRVFGARWLGDLEGLVDKYV